MTHRSLALRLRVLRAERALTIEQAAARAGVTPETISDAERGRRHPYVPTLRKLAAGYGVPVEELLASEAEESEAALPGMGKAEAPYPGQRSSRSSESREDEARGPERASPSAPVGTLEWAVAAPENEYARWIERASSMELHAMFAKLRADTDDPRRPLILDRAQAAIYEFFRRNPIEEFITRGEAGSADEASEVTDREVG